MAFNILYAKTDNVKREVGFPIKNLGYPQKASNLREKAILSYTPRSKSKMLLANPNNPLHARESCFLIIFPTFPNARFSPKTLYYLVWS